MTEDELFEDVRHWKAHADAAEAMSKLQTEARLRAERTIDLLEQNAGIQAKLLADTGRQRDALVKAMEEILKHMDGNGMQDWTIAKKARAALADVGQAQVSGGE